jgi:O-antigen/teichoic acid export membrane protein
MRLPNLLISSTFTRNLLTLITGNTIALIIPIILYPLLSRIFTPEDYALFGVYFSVYIFLEIASAGRYELAVVIPKKDSDAMNLVAGSLLISLGYSILILILVIFFREWLAQKLNNPGLADWLFILPPSLLLVSISKLCNNWLIRRKQFKASSINKASQKLAETFAQLILGILKTGNGLVLGDATGRLFNAFFSFYQSIHSGLQRSHVDIKTIKALLKQYVEFPKFGILPAMLNTLAGMLPVFIISAYYSAEISGSFNFSRIILSVPFALISAGISQVLMQQVSERRNNQETISAELFSLAIKLAMLSVLGIIVLWAAAPQLFEFIFGIKWKQSGEFTSILIFSYAITFIISPFSILLSVLGKIKLLSIWQVFYFLLSCSLWVLRDVKIETFLFFLVMVDIVSYLLYGLIIYRSVRNYELKLASQQ